MRRQGNKGFTLIEIVIVIMLLGIIAIVAIPQFIDMRTEARDEATKAALAAFRSSVAIVVGAIAVKENPNLSPKYYPTFSEFSGNLMLAASPANHAKLAGTAVMDKASGIPINPWTTTNVIHDCDGMAKGTLLIAPNADDGWCYNTTSGEVWANSDLSKGTVKENLF